MCGTPRTGLSHRAHRGHRGRKPSQIPLRSLCSLWLSYFDPYLGAPFIEMIHLFFYPLQFAKMPVHSWRILFP